MSLVNATNYATATTLYSSKAFRLLFFYNDHIKNHPSKDLVLPATTLSQRCYDSMFSGCTGLTRAPELPATTLANNCYAHMFQSCSNLSSVTCYATTTATGATFYWLEGVASSGTFYAPTNGVLNNEASGVSAIPEGWTLIPVLYYHANFAINFRTNPYAVLGDDDLPAGVEVTGEIYQDGTHGYSAPVISIPIKAGNYLVKMGACQYSYQDGTVTNEDGSVTYATLATNLGENKCYHQNMDKNYVAAIITIPSDQVIKVHGAQYTPYFSIAPMPEIPAFTNFEINFRTNEYTVLSGALPTGTDIAGTHHDNQHGYENVIATVPAKAGTYRLTLGTCQFGTGTGNVMSETNVELAAFNQNTGVCYDANPTTNIVSKTFTIDKDQHITIKCGQYTPYMKLEKISAYAVSFALDGAEGVAPAATNVTIGDAITMPVNKTMYKDGYTLTGWTDGVDTYAIGADFTPTTDAALTPVFTANTVDLLNASTETTVKWFFGESNGAPSVHWEGNSGILVAQALVDTKTIDVKLAIDATSGKFQNSGRDDQWAQVRANTVFSFPSKEGMTVDVNTYSGNPTYDLGDGTLTCNTDDYYSYLELTFPAPVQVLTANPDPDHAGDYYSTFYHSAIAYELSAGVEAYVATLSGDALNLTKIAEGGQVIPADNAVILKANSGSITLTPSDAAAVSFTATNNLHGVDEPTAAPTNCYVLSGHSSDNSVTGVGFYQYTGTLKAHKAYAVISGGAAYAPKKLRFVFNAATGVESIQPSAVSIQKVLRDGQLIIIRNGVEYNANGQMVK